jgi:alpha-N-arabinofuranosidase
MIKELITAFTITLTACSLQATEYHVSPGGLDSNKGSKSKPFKTISAAATVAQPGDLITVHEGTYRERVNPPRGGISDDKRIVYQAVPGEKVVIKGSEIIKQWEKIQEGVWKVTLPNSFFGDFNPYNDIIQGEWQDDKGYPRNTGTIYVNGTWMDEAETVEQVVAPIGKLPLWKAEVDEKNTTICAQFKGIDPNKELVEINVRQSVFYPDEPGRNYITVRGFTMRHAATPWSGAMSEQIGLIGTHWSKGWIIENNRISHSMNTGITLGRYDLGRYGIKMPEATAPGFVESIKLALEHGWSKEKIGSHVVRNNHISHCEKNGIHGSLGGIFSTIEGNTICDIAMRGWIGGADVAGLKLLGSHDTIIKGNYIYRCGGFGGMWLDWMAQGTRVTGNLFHDNSRFNLFMEVNHGPFVIDNNIFLPSRVHDLKDCSQGGAYLHNLIVGSIGFTGGAKRKTPFHEAHSTKIADCTDLSGGDNRFYNNMFLGEDVLKTYDEARQPITAVGNLVIEAATIIKKPDGVYLEITTRNRSERKAGEHPMVTTELLGKTKVSGLPYDNPDGSHLRIDRDYFGNKREQNNVACGPFTLLKEGKQRIKIWPKKGL